MLFGRRISRDADQINNKSSGWRDADAREREMERSKDVGLRERFGCRLERKERRAERKREKRGGKIQGRGSVELQLRLTPVSHLENPPYSPNTQSNHRR